MNQLRLFVAVDIPADLKEAIARGVESCRRVAPEAKWVKPENLHLTLKFLGAVDQDAVDRTAAAFEDACRTAGVMRMALEGPGAFPDTRHARVFWLGMSGDMSMLAELARKVDDRMALLGHERETRPFTGHITLARMRRPADVAHLLACWEKQEGIAGTSFSVDEAVLYRSELDREGARYEAVRRVVLRERTGL